MTIGLCAELDGAYRQTAGRLDTNVALEIQRIAGMDRPDLSALERLDEPAELSDRAPTSTRCCPIGCCRRCSNADSNARVPVPQRL